MAALLVNILVWPGIGTLIGGRTGEGVTQLLLWAFAFLMMFTLFWLIFPIFLAIAIWIGVWIWSLITGIQLLQEAQRARPAYPAYRP